MVPTSALCRRSSQKAGVQLILVLMMLLALAEGSRTNTSALFVFGDSTVDPGNNNFLLTLQKANHPPYGRDFPGHIPTGRFTNGKLVTDFIVSYLGIKEFVPPYLDPNLTLEDLKTGVSFASAGTGFNSLMAGIKGVISMKRQLEHFREYKSRMESYIGKTKTESLVKKATVVISAGSNDLIESYFLVPIRNKTYISASQNFILQQEQLFIQRILELGVRNIVVAGAAPIGCLPAVTSLASGFIFNRRTCIESVSAIAKEYNALLQAKLAAFQTQATNVMYLDIYKPLNDLIARPHLYGFSVAERGCCGGQVIGISVPCNLGSPTCSDASKYVFWDSVHPTQAAYYKMFLSFIPALDRFYSKFVM